MESYKDADSRIEDLPEDVVCRIFWWLPMRDAARASASCSAFLRAWGRYPRLSFEEDTLGLRRPPPLRPHDAHLALQRRDEHASGFVRRVDDIMASRCRRRSSDEDCGAALDALVLRFAYLRERDAACVDRWVRLALASTTTRLLTLDFQPHVCYNPDRLQYDFPCSLLSAALDLEHLYLRQGSLRLRPQCEPLPRLTNLATLVLAMVRVTGEDLDHLLSSCHSLHTLKLRRCEGLQHVRLSRDRCLKQLRLLVVKYCWSVRSIDVSGSAVESLRFDGRHLAACLLRGSSLSVPAFRATSASFDLEYPAAAEADDAAIDSSRLELLSLARLMPGLETLSLNLVQDVKVDMTSPHGGNVRFHHLKRVHLGMYMHGRHGRDDFLFLYPFLDAAPALQELSLDVKRYAPAFNRRRPKVQPAEPVGYFRNHQGLTHHSLRAVHMAGFDADRASLELLLYILDKGLALQRISLEPWIRIYEGEVPHITVVRKIRLIQQAIARYIEPAVPSGSGIVLQLKRYKSIDALRRST